MAKATIKDVAREAGVSVSTVSFAINNSRPVSKETRQRIARAIETTGYTPNINARSLRTNKTNLIGIVVADIQNAAFLTFYDHAESYLSDHGYSIILCNLGKDIHSKGKNYIDLLINRGVDGMIITGMNNLADYARSHTNLPIVAARKTPSKTFSTVYCDTIKGAYMAARYLFERHSESLDVFTPALTKPTYLDRMSGVYQAAGEMGIDLNGIVTHFCEDNSIVSGFKAMEGLIKQKILPRTIFAFNDEIAVGILQCLLTNGIRVPQDTLLIGFDDTPAALVTTPTLASVHQPMDILREIAATELISTISDPHYAVRSICIDPKLITDRGTVCLSL